MSAKGEDFGTLPRVPMHPRTMKFWEYSVWHATYDTTLLESGGIEQGYRLPHYTDHEWPERDWSEQKLIKECGHFIGGGRRGRPDGAYKYRKRKA